MKVKNWFASHAGDIGVWLVCLMVLCAGSFE